MQRYRGDRRSIWSSHTHAPPQAPWMNSTAGPSPRSSTHSIVSFACTSPMSISLAWLVASLASPPFGNLTVPTLAAVRVRVLGPISVELGERVLSGRALGGARERRLLAVLAWARGSVVSRDAVIEAVWN